MRKDKYIFLLSIMLVVGIMLTGCGTTSLSDGTVATNANDQLGQILDAVASQEPAETLMAAVTDVAAMDDSQVPTPEVPAADVVEPTATPEPSPTPTPEPIDVDKTVPSTYILRGGEFPWCIARRFNIDPIALMNANGIPSGQAYFTAGLTLTIPNNIGVFEGDPQLRAHTSPYNVKTGDTFYSIACYYGDLWPEEIAAANNMELGDSLPAGTELIIP